MSEFSLHYKSPSTLTEGEGGKSLALSAAVSGGGAPFFQGQLLSPRLTARTLHCLSQMIRQRWYDPSAIAAQRAAMLDPIVTSEGQHLRFEGFSGCRSLYARVDLLPESLNVVSQQPGTTNVDFNQPMCQTLMGINTSDVVSLHVAEDALSLIKQEEVFVEKKVNLPLSWLKGLASIPSMMSCCEVIIEFKQSAIVKIFNQLPRVSSERECYWLIPDANSPRLSRHPTSDAIPITAPRRLLEVSPLIHEAKRLTVAVDPQGSMSLWTFHFIGLRLTVALSPEVWRGFSGEGMALVDLGKHDDPDLPDALLESIGEYSLDELAIKSGSTLPHVRSALNYLAGQGLVGYDFTSDHWFRRSLPGNDKLLAKTNPRQARAQVWVDDGAVSFTESSPAETLATVIMKNGAVHHVRMRHNHCQCTCYWHSTFGNDRGPCSHILAVQIKQRL